MSEIISLCVIRIEICEDHSDRKILDELNAMTSHDKFLPSRGRRSVKNITIETYTNASSKPDPLLKNDRCATKSEKLEKSGSSKECSVVDKDEKKNNVVDLRSEPINFVSGNPYVEVTKGVLHLYKADKLTDMNHESVHCQIVCILAVPATMTCHNLLTFTAACQENIRHIRIISDGSVNQYMALIYFKTKEATIEFYRTFNGVSFNSLEPEYVCQLVFVSQVEIGNEVEAICPPSGHTELPTCPVCLERMDESVKGILTILCNHSFHSKCLKKWSDHPSCPVCRYVPTPEVVPENKCFECRSSESLWICLICGHVGCGRYVGGHAQKHYTDTSHCFSMQLGNNRVWDYAGDNFVHRLLQNKDGKLVEGPSPEKHNPEQPSDLQEKVDSVQLEFTYLLTSQLESQRNYFEKEIARLRKETKRKSAGVQESALSREKQLTDKKVQQLSTKLSQMQVQLNEEKQLNSALQMNQVGWQTKFTKLENEFNEYKKSKELELVDLKEQLRDVMFFFEAQKKIAESSEREEIAEGTIVITESPASSSKPKSRRTKKR